MNEQKNRESRVGCLGVIDANAQITARPRNHLVLRGPDGNGVEVLRHDKAIISRARLGWRQVLEGRGCSVELVEHGLRLRM